MVAIIDRNHASTRVYEPFTTNTVACRAIGPPPFFLLIPRYLPQVLSGQAGTAGCLTAPNRLYSPDSSHVKISLAAHSQAFGLVCLSVAARRASSVTSHLTAEPVYSLDVVGVSFVQGLQRSSTASEAVLGVLVPIAILYTFRGGLRDFRK